MGASTVEVVFVHGLKGGSLTTWRGNDNIDVTLFWRERWLHNDDVFEDFPIHILSHNSS